MLAPWVMLPFLGLLLCNLFSNARADAGETIDRFFESVGAETETRRSFEL